MREHRNEKGSIAPCMGICMLATAGIAAVMLVGCSEEKGAIASQTSKSSVIGHEMIQTPIDRDDLDKGALMTALERGWPYLTSLDTEDGDMGRYMTMAPR